MRHQNKIKKIGRTRAHRHATLAALSNALIQHKRIQTTFVKAKALRTFVEPLITRTKDDTTANRRQVFRHLQSKDAIKELFDEIAGKVATRPGGYTRIVKLGQRPGDGTEMAVIELVDYNTTGEQATKTATRRRTRRSAPKPRGQSETVLPGDAAPATTPETPVAQDTPDTSSDANAQAPGTPLDGPEATAGGDAANPEAGTAGNGGESRQA